jgi:hypothetical protein
VKSSSKTTDCGLIRFDQFMAAALYGPRGYYTSPRPVLGFRGDFTTTPKLTTALARRITLWIQKAWQRRGARLPVIELGPGDGTLARDIRQSLGFFIRRHLDYHFVEISPHLAARQQEENKGTWHLTLKEALEKTGGRALIISNEFFDAFPVRIFNRELEELFLNQNRQETWQSAIELPDSSLFEKPPKSQNPFTAGFKVTFPISPKEKSLQSTMGAMLKKSTTAAPSGRSAPTPTTCAFSRPKPTKTRGNKTSPSMSFSPTSSAGETKSDSKPNRSKAKPLSLAPTITRAPAEPSKSSTSKRKRPERRTGHRAHQS